MSLLTDGASAISFEKLFQGVAIPLSGNLFQVRILSRELGMMTSPSSTLILFLNFVLIPPIYFLNDAKSF